MCRRLTSLKILLFVFLISISIVSEAAIFVVSGIYQGRNLLVKNPTLADGTTRIINAVYVNDQKVEIDLTQPVCEINLSHIRRNSQVTIKILHKDGEKPKLMNPQVIKPASNFHINSFVITADAFIWSTRGEKPRGKYVIERLENDQWMVVKEIPAKGSMILNNYDTDGVIAGSHKYRLKLYEENGRVHYSNIVEFTK